MGLPFAGLSGRGVHVNLSLLDHDGTTCCSTRPPTTGSPTRRSRRSPVCVITTVRSRRSARRPSTRTGDGFEEVNTDVAAPSDLAEALDHLESATDFTAALGQDVVDNFVEIERAEWDRFIEAEEKFDPTGPVTKWS